MKKLLAVLVLASFFLTFAAASFAEDAAAIQNKITKLEREINNLEAKLATTKNKTQRGRIQKTMEGHRKVIADYNRQLLGMRRPVKVEVLKVRVVEQPQKILAVKGGLAGGAALIAADFMMPVGPMYLGGEAGYAIGNNFGIIDAGVKGIYSFGGPFAGLEISYAGYSKDVTQVPGLSGTIKAGVGVGLLGGMVFGPVQACVGYNTALGLRADAGYRLMF